MDQPYEDEDEDDTPQTAYAVARDEHVLALVCEALVFVAHKQLAKPIDEATFDWLHVNSAPMRFAARAANGPEQFQHATALALLSREDAPTDPCDVAWMRTSLEAMWPTLSRACLFGF